MLLFKWKCFENIKEKFYLMSRRNEFTKFAFFLWHFYFRIVLLSTTLKSVAVKMSSISSSYRRSFYKQKMISSSFWIFVWGIILFRSLLFCIIFLNPWNDENRFLNICGKSLHATCILNEIFGNKCLAGTILTTLKYFLNIKVIV